MTILQVKNIDKNFGPLKVLKNISFSMEKGETIAIIGSSGSGKTTLLRCLNFLEKPNRGSISVNDEKIFDAKDSPRQEEDELRKKRLNFGLVFQNFNLFPQYTVLENVTLSAKLLAKERPNYKDQKREILKEIDQKARLLLSRVELTDKLNSYPHEISGGQEQRVAIARALILNPHILCFDEPTSALDPELTGQVVKVIRKLAKDDTSMIVVTHEMDFARSIADRVLFMDDGMIIEEGSPEEVFDNPKEKRTKEFLTSYKEN